MGIHLLQCSHGKECTTFHDVVRNTFLSIVKDVKFHIFHEYTHVFPIHSPSFLFSQQLIDIVLFTYGVYALVDVVIVNLTQINLVSKVISFKGATIFKEVIMTITT
jgi:hypothetical protein